MLTTLASWLFEPPKPEVSLEQMLQKQGTLKRTLGQQITELSQLILEARGTGALQIAIGATMRAQEIEELSNTLGRLAHQMLRTTTPETIKIDADPAPNDSTKLPAMSYADFVASRRQLTIQEHGEILSAGECKLQVPREQIFMYAEGFIIEETGTLFFPHAWWYSPVSKDTREQAEKELYAWRNEWTQS